MQSKKGIYFLIGIISTILIFFFILFFVHENTLENGILFTVSFEYPGAQDIEYNFYNQNGKIEKVEGDTKFLLEKTDYNSVKLLRKITKKLEESKKPFQEEGITIYNGQNKRYYLIPFQSNSAEELSSLIIDGYIHSELKRTVEKEINELYIYKDDQENLKWTKDGSVKKIIHTYQCMSNSCKFLQIDTYDTLLMDEKYYYYNYGTYQKKEINIDFDIKEASILKWKNSIKGFELTTNDNLNIYYDLEENKTILQQEKYHYKFIENSILLMSQKYKKEDSYCYEFIIYDLNKNQKLWEKEREEKSDVDFQIIKTRFKEKELYILKSVTNQKEKYTLLDEKGITILEKENALKVQEKYILKNEIETYYTYDSEQNSFQEIIEDPKN